VKEWACLALDLDFSWSQAFSLSAAIILESAVIGVSIMNLSSPSLQGGVDSLPL